MMFIFLLSDNYFVSFGEILTKENMTYLSHSLLES